jgi:hypothetical protein
MNTPEGLPLLTCLKFKPTGLPWLIVEDTEYEREGALVLIFGEDWQTSLRGAPESVIVQRVSKTRAYLDALPEWEP